MHQRFIARDTSSENVLSHGTISRQKAVRDAASVGRRHLYLLLQFFELSSLSVRVSLTVLQKSVCNYISAYGARFPSLLLVSVYFL